MFRRMRGCPATGKNYHVFDKTTHKCKCGRWERGFKPKVEFVLARDECQICEREQAINANGSLVHHGYRRPGWGFIVGDCMGTDHQPYPCTDALEKYLIAVDAHIDRITKRLAKLPTLTTYEYKYIDRTSGKKEEKTRTINKGEEYRYDATERRTWPAFETLIENEKRAQETELKMATRERERVVARIHKADLPLEAP